MAMTWNHRVVRHQVAGVDGSVFMVHEVYYDDQGGRFEDDKGNGISMTQNGVRPMGETPDELMIELSQMLSAFEKPVLDADDPRLTCEAQRVRS